MDYAKNLNDANNYFPVLGLSRGHLAIHLYETKNPAIITENEEINVTELISFTDSKNRIFNLTTDDNLNKYKSSPVGYSHRHHCILLETFASMYESDPSKYIVVGVDKHDDESPVCVTITEARDYPFFTVQYRVEQILYDFSKPEIPHDASSRMFAEDIAFFFARETRNSINYYDSYIHVTMEYIWNNNRVYSLANSVADLYRFHVVDPATTLFSK